MKTLTALVIAFVALPLSGQLQQGQALFKQARYEEARRVLTPLTSDPDAIATLGRIALVQDDDDRAIELLSKAVSMRPGSAEFHFHLGEAYGSAAQKAGMLRQASLASKVHAEFERSVELDPNFTDARFGLIDFYLLAPSIMGGSADKAIQQAVEIRKRDAYLGHRAHARIFTRQKKLDLARREWLDYVKEEPQSAKAHTALGSFLGLNDKKFRDAFEELDTAIRLDPAYMPAWFRVAQVAAESGAQLTRGEEAMRKYLAYTPTEKEPDLASAHYYLGLIYEKQGKKAEAKVEYLSALRLNPAVRPFKEAVKRMG